MSRLNPGDIYQQGSAARLAQMLEAQKQAAEAAWLQSGGLSPSGQVYRSPSGMIAPGPSDVDARGMLPLGGGSGPGGAYDPQQPDIGDLAKQRAQSMFPNKGSRQSEDAYNSAMKAGLLPPGTSRRDFAVAPQDTFLQMINGHAVTTAGPDKYGSRRPPTSYDAAPGPADAHHVLRYPEDAPKVGDAGSYQPVLRYPEDAPKVGDAVQYSMPGAYDPRGIPASVETASGPKTAVQTGNPFFDVNTNFAQLEKERQLKNQNDAVFTEQNNRRLGAIAEARNAADALRAANLAGQGMTQEQIDMRMHPERFAAPKDPAIEQAKAIDLAERQGRGAVDAMARKFMRNGLSPAQAYAAAFNSMPTTNPANQGAVPSLPGMDPMRIAGFMGAGPGMAAGQYGVGMERAGMEGLARGQESRDRLAGTQAQAGAHRDVGLAQAGATAQNGLLEFILGLLKNKQTDSVLGGEQRSAETQQAMEYLGSPQAEQDRNSPDPARRAFHQGMMDKALGAAGPGNQQPAPTQGAGAPLSSAFGGGRDEFLASNPQALAQHLAAFPDSEKARERARIMTSGGHASHPSVRDYLVDRYNTENPNLFFGPDYWRSSYGDAGTPGFLVGLLGGESEADALARHSANNWGIPADVAKPIFQSYLNSIR